jgi:tellurite resistance protein TehA-like permease
MSNDESQVASPSRFLEDTTVRYFLPWHFISCWRGERTVADTLLSSVVAYAVIGIALFLLNDFAQKRGLFPEFELVLSVLGLIGLSLFVTGFVFSMWRSARHDFLLGRWFWPIVASLVAVGIATAFLTRVVLIFVRLLTLLG